MIRLITAMLIACSILVGPATAFGSVHRNDSALAGFQLDARAYATYLSARYWSVLVTDVEMYFQWYRWPPAVECGEE